MIREYASPREYLDDLIAQGERLASRHHRASSSPHDDLAERAVAELGLEIERMDELIRGRCEATVEVGTVLPLDRMRRAFQLSVTEMRVIEVLVALELSAQVRQVAAPYLGANG
ncbi:MAG TPA: hypothetical protein VLB44_05850, partial [Kofleriaceae bacterium]|nr:hypothetical protein [Kofleriaceae bacterium]